MPSRIIITYSLALAMCAAILCGSACAADTGTDSSIIVDKFVQAFLVNRDDSYVVTTDNVKTIVQQRAVLLEALLTSGGIDNSAALINSGNAYRLPRTPTLGVFEHVITCIPSLALFFDSTSASTAAGTIRDGVGCAQNQKRHRPGIGYRVSGIEAGAGADAPGRVVQGVSLD